MKKTFLLFCCFCCSLMFAQDFSISWQAHSSYFNVKSITEADNILIIAAENAVFEYDTETQETKTYTTVDGLSGNGISETYYSANYNIIVVGHNNGLIQLIDRDSEQVTNLVDIVNRVTISPDRKSINHFLEYQNKLYIATSFGIVEFKLSSEEFGDTFYIGENGTQVQVNQTAINPNTNTIYAATFLDGIRYADLSNPNLIDFNYWNQISNGTYTAAAFFKNNIYLARLDNSLIKIENNQQVLENTYSTPIRDLRVSQNNLLAITATEVYGYDSQLDEELLAFNPAGIANLDLETAILKNDFIYLGDRNLGLIQETLPPSASQPKFLSPDGPILNRVFSLTTAENELWVTYGEYTQFFNPYPLNSRGISHFKNNLWSNITFEDLGDSRVLTDVSIDSENPNKVYISSFIDGLLTLENKVLINRDNADNSNIENVNNVTNDARIGASVIGQDNNLYFTNSLTSSPIKKKSPSGEISSINFSNTLTSPETVNVAKITTDQNGIIFAASFEDGILAYDPSTGATANITRNTAGVDFPSVTNDNPIISALKADKNNRLWIGTSDGLRVLFNPSSVFDPAEGINISSIIIEEDDGVAQELLYEQSITAIAVDGANNKWIGTADSGVFQVSPNGQDVLQHFTQDNSPLPSNNITAIAIDGSSGIVYLGTTDGLVSYRSNITEPQENLSQVRVFPNPVRPSNSGTVTIDGLSQEANVKITDINGNLVYEEITQGGSVIWDTTAFGQYKVASGVYLVLVTGTDEVDTQVKKIMIIR
ncbi:MAG: two-component regulator propeller domain-containing protein [Bacteroidota bacterium]